MTISLEVEMRLREAREVCRSSRLARLAHHATRTMRNGQKVANTEIPSPLGISALHLLRATRLTRQQISMTNVCQVMKLRLAQIIVGAQLEAGFSQ